MNIIGTLIASSIQKSSKTTLIACFWFCFGLSMLDEASMSCKSLKVESKVKCSDNLCTINLWVGQVHSSCTILMLQYYIVHVYDSFNTRVF